MSVTSVTRRLALQAPATTSGQETHPGLAPRSCQHALGRGPMASYHAAEVEEEGASHEQDNRYWPPGS